mgnify:CR=1 FL=1
MEWIFNQLRERPELAIFLTIFLGFWLGKLRIGKFTLGTVTSVLLVGVVVGQLKIALFAIAVIVTLLNIALLFVQ